MLGYVLSGSDDRRDELLAYVAGRLHDDGVRVAAAVQVNVINDTPRSDMDLHIIPTGRVVRISQRLGPMATGCRLDVQQLEEAAGLLQSVLEDSPDLLILNKFGKQEAAGRGFAPVVAAALDRGIPVLIGVPQQRADDFAEFAGDMAAQVANDPEAALAWCQAAVMGAVDE